MAAELAETDRMRRDLVANVSHELRTPITALQAVLENLVDGVAEPDPETLRTMLAQVERLGRLVQQLLDLSRLESGTLPLDRSAVRGRADARARGARVAAARDPTSASRSSVEPADLTLEADAERLHQVVANLVENAVRHSPRGGTVRGAGAPRPPTACTIEVLDEGPGIPEAEADPRLRTLLPRRLRALVERRRCRPRPGDRPLDRRPARRRDPSPNARTRTAAAWS